MQEIVVSESLTPVSEGRYTQLFETESLRGNLKSKSIRGSVFTLSAEVANLFLTIGATSVLARMLMPADFGLLGMVFALTAIAERFKDIGLGRATVQKPTLTHAEVSNLFWLNSGIGLAICLAISSMSGLIAQFYHEQRLTHIAIAISITFIFSSITIQHQALLTRRMKFGAISIINTGSQVASSLIAIGLALKGLGYWSLVWREISRSALVAAGTWIFCPWIPGLPSRRTEMGRLMLFGRDISFFNLVTYFTRSLDQLLLGKFSGANALGIYRQAFQLIMLPVNQVTSPIQAVSEPAFSALQQEQSKYRVGFQKTVRSVGMITMPLAIGAFVCAKPLILFVFGPKWIAAEPIFKILALAAFIRPAVSTMGFVMVSCGKTARYAMLGFIDSVVLILAIVVGLHWGPKGVAFGHVAATYTVFLPFLWWAFKETPVNLRLWVESVTYPAVCSIVMGLVLSLIYRTLPIQSSPEKLVVLVLAGVVAYVGSMGALSRGRYILRELTQDLRSALRA